MAGITKIQLRRGTAAAWTSANPTLAAGEPGWETDTRKIKYGDGSTAWNSLPYFVLDGFVYDRAEQVADLPITATTSATATIYLTGHSVAYDGTSRVLLEWWTSAIYLVSGTNATWVATLYDGSTDKNLIISQGDISGTAHWPAFGRYSFIPTAGNHTWSVAFYKAGGAGTPQVNGDGGGTYSPSGLRVIKEKT